MKQVKEEYRLLKRVLRTAAEYTGNVRKRDNDVRKELSIYKVNVILCIIKRTYRRMTSTCLKNGKNKVTWNHS